MLSESIKEKALNYELEYSKAYGADITDYENFIHIKNKFVNYSGDFNRAIYLKFKDFDEFDRIVSKVNEIHSLNGLEKPNSYYVSPPKLDETTWEEYLLSKGFRLKQNFCMIREVVPIGINSEIIFINPNNEEYFKWYYAKEKKTSYFNEDWYGEVLPAIKTFINDFKPFWMVKDNEIIGWVYCQFTNEICNVHDVWIEELHRGKGLSRIMFDFINNESIKRKCRYINVFAFEDRKAFYEKLGFHVYEEISVIRTINK